MKQKDVVIGSEYNIKMDGKLVRIKGEHSTLLAELNRLGESSPAENKSTRKVNRVLPPNQILRGGERKGIGAR